MEGLTFRKGEEKDLSVLKELFCNTITTVCAKDYGPEQIAVWTSSIQNQERWQKLISDQYVLLAELEKDTVVGFITLKDNDYLDFAYVHQDYQGQGIAQQLYHKIEELAKAKGALMLSSDVSITARPFFEKMGFKVLKEQENMRQGVALNNYKMTKELSPNQ